MIIDNQNEIAEKKLILLYLLKTINIPIAKKHFASLVVNNGIMNYFLMQHLIDNLVVNNYLIVNSDNNYKISDKGVETLNFLMHKVPKGIKKLLDRLADEEKVNIKRETQIKANLALGNKRDFLSVLEISEDSNPLLEIKIAAGNKKEAKEICDNFKSHASEIYTEIIKVLTKQRD